MSGVAEPAVQHEKTQIRPLRGRRAGAASKGRRCVAFPELVQTHFIREKALDDGAIYSGPEEERYREFEAAFERQHGRIVSAYWCTSTPSAVALTRRDSSKRSQRTMTFHRVTDWATKDEPEIADALHECDELAVRAAQVLHGKTQQICMELVMTSAGHLLSLVDGRSEHEAKGKKELALRLERRKLEKTRAYYHQAANGLAQLYYFGGMIIGALVLALLSLAIAVSYDLPGINNRDLFGSITAGALGAFVSVMARIGSGHFRLDFDVGRRYPIFLGALRPLIGAIFGVALYFAVTSSLLDVFNVPDADKPNQRFYFLLVIAFAAGFSERWARDTLLSFGAPTPTTAPRKHDEAMQPGSG